MVLLTFRIRNSGFKKKFQNYSRIRNYTEVTGVSAKMVTPCWGSVNKNGYAMLGKWLRHAGEVSAKMVTPCWGSVSKNDYVMLAPTRK